jgi:hypothetical protein
MVPNAPVPNIEIEEEESPLIIPLPIIVEFTDALPNVNVFKISVEEVNVMALPPFGPSQSKLLSKRKLPPDLLITI